MGTERIFNTIETGFNDNEFSTQFSKLFPIDLNTIPQWIKDNCNENYGVKNVTFVVTQECNLRCTYCYECGKNKENDMSIETAKRGIDFLFEEYAKTDPYSKFINPWSAKGIILDMMGGEPLLAIDVVEELYEYFLDKCIELKHPWGEYHMLALATNGVLYMQPKVQKFLDKYFNKISVGITIDGNKELHDACRVFPDGSGSYDIVEKSVLKHLERNKTYSTKLTISVENMDYLIDAVLNMKNLGMRNMHANCVFEESWTNKDAKRFYNILKKLGNMILNEKLYKTLYVSLFDMLIGAPMSLEDNNNWCGGTGAMLGIDAKGDIYPCVRYMAFTLVNNREKLIIGNIYDGFLKTKRQVEIITSLDKITRQSQSTLECFNCPIAGGCAWCSGYNYDYFGTANKRATFICPTHKGRVMANVYFWNKYFNEIDDPVRVFENHMPLEWAKELDMEEEWYEIQKLVDDRKEKLKKIKEKELENTNVYLAMF